MEYFGPISISGFKPAATHVFDALAAGRRVLLSKHDRVVVAIEPHTLIRPELIALYAVPGEPPLPELSASVINQGSPSALVNRAIDEGVPSYVTRDSTVYGVLHAPSAERLAAMAPSFEDLDWMESRLDDVASNPGAGMEEMVGVGEEIAQHVGIGRNVSVAHVSGYPVYVDAGGAALYPAGGAFSGGGGHFAAAPTAPGAVERGRLEGRRLWQYGAATEDHDPVLAQEAYGAAASHGDVRAMLRLANRATSLGNGQAARYWYEAAILDEPLPGPTIASRSRPGHRDVVAGWNVRREPAEQA